MYKVLLLASPLAIGVLLGYGLRGVTDPSATMSASYTPELAAPVPAKEAADSTAYGAMISVPMTVAPAKGASTLVQQSTGTICETPAGSCRVRPLPINSRCQCGGTTGTIVR